MAIDWQRPEYEDSLPDWQMVDIVCDERGLDQLLPTINPHDLSEENSARNEFYRERASWFGASQFTLQSLLGTAFGSDPELSFPTALEYLADNADGGGLDAKQQLQSLLSQSLRKGRCGLFVTYPPRQGDTSRADQLSGEAIATIHVVDASRIINWWPETRGAKVMLGGVVFTDTIETVEDYEVKTTECLRELALEGGFFVDRKWIKDAKSSQWSVMEGSEHFPTTGSGALWTEIPFQFVGSTDNTLALDRPPMLSLARKNRDHYRNSADFEESTFFAGSPQPWAKGINMDDVTTAKKAGFYIGARQLIVADNFAFAQAEANPMSRQAMQDKVEEMKAIGARFLDVGGVAKTAQQDSGERKVQHSILSLAASNVEQAYNHALQWVSEYMRAPEALVSMPRDYMDPDVSVELIREFVGLWDRGLVGAVEAHGVLMRAKLIDGEKTVDDYAEEVAARGGGQGVDDDADD